MNAGIAQRTTARIAVGVAVAVAFAIAIAIGTGSLDAATVIEAGRFRP